MILQFDDWKFDVDIPHTMQYSAIEAAGHCDCGYCRNFYAAVDAVCPQLRSFMAQFGVDLEAPETLFPYDVDQKMIYEGEYLVFGSILQEGSGAFQVGETTVFPLEDTEYDLPQPYFLLSLEHLVTPWVLQEPMEDVVSTANDPEFLQTMQDRLLDRVLETDVQ